MNWENIQIHMSETWIDHEPVIWFVEMNLICRSELWAHNQRRSGHIPMGISWRGTEKLTWTSRVVGASCDRWSSKKEVFHLNKMGKGVNFLLISQEITDKEK